MSYKPATLVAGSWHKSTTDSKSTVDSKPTVPAHESTIVDEHETGEVQTTASVNDNTVVRPEVATTPVTTVNATAPTTREEVKEQHEGKLPQTSNQNAFVAIVLGTASAIFGFGLATKKRY